MHARLRRLTAGYRVPRLGAGRRRVSSCRPPKECRDRPMQRSRDMTTTEETGNITGTADKDYNLIWFTEACLSNALRLDVYIKDAQRSGDSELVDFFQRAQNESKKGAEQA